MAWSIVGVGATVESVAGAITLTLPAGYSGLSGDLIVACFSWRSGTAASPTKPASWNIGVEELNSNTLTTSSALPCGAVHYIVRGGSDPALGWTFTNINVNLGKIVVYRGSHATPKTADNGGATSATNITAVSLAGLTTTTANELIVAAFCGGQESTFTALDAATDPTTGSGAGIDATTNPTAGTWFRRGSTNTTSGADTGLTIGDAVRATAGATGNITATASVASGQVICAVAFKLASGPAPLDAGGGSFAVSGTAASLELGRKVAAASGSFAISGTAATLKKNLPLVAGSGTFAVTGTAATLRHAYKLAADAGSFAISGTAASFAFSGAGDLRGTLTGQVPSVTNPMVATGSVVVSVGDLVFGTMSQQTQLTATTTITDNLGNTYAFVNAGTDAGFVSGRSFYSRVTVAGTLTTVNVPAVASGSSASIVVDVIAGPFKTSPLDANPANTTDAVSPFTCPATGTLAQASEVVMAAISIATNTTPAATSPSTITGVVARDNVSTAQSRRVVSATTSVTPEFTAGSSTDAVQTTASFKIVSGAEVAADAGSFAVNGTAATFKRTYKLTAETAAFAVSGTAASLEQGYEVPADAGSFAVSGTAASLRHGYKVIAEAGSFAFSGTAATFRRTYRLIAEAASFVVSGTAASLKHGRELATEAASFLFSGTDATLTVTAEKILSADAGSFAVSGTDASLEWSRKLPAEATAFTVSGTDASLERGYKLPADSGSFAVSGTGSTLQVLRRLHAESGIFLVGGTDAALTVGAEIVLAAETGTFAVSGTAADLTVDTVVVEPPAPEIGGPIVGGHFSRGRWRELRDLKDAIRDARRAEELKKKRAKAKLEKATQAAEAVAEAVARHDELAESARLNAIAAALDAATAAQTVAATIRHADEVLALAKRLLIAIAEAEEEEEAIMLLMAL